MTTFRDFRKLCCSVYHTDSYKEKSELIKKFISDRNDDIYLIIKLLLPGLDDRIYNMNDKQIIKLYSIIFDQQHDEMLNDFKAYGYIGDTIKTFFTRNTNIKPLKNSILTLKDVDNFLTDLSFETKESRQLKLLSYITGLSTSNDLKCIVMLISKDLKIKAGPRYVLNAISDTAYDVFRKTNNLQHVIENTEQLDKISISVMTPINPMLAESCTSVEKAFKKFPDGMFAEVKYDGERVQVHKHENQFSFFSRNMKPVLKHKVDYLREYLPKAFKNASSLILDSEIVLVDENNKPLPFGSLGIHKKNEYANSSMCLFVFDCLYFDGFDMTDIPLFERRSLLQEIMVEIPNRIMFSELKIVKEIEELSEVLNDALERKLEGLIIKNVSGHYEPGKRRWLKIKKDYLKDGSLADSVDLVVLGAYYGKGSKGGIMAVFLMGCYDDDIGKWKTVTKCSGHDDETLKELQTQLKMIKIGKDHNKIPDWLIINKIHYPDFIVVDPKESPVWEIIGSEFTSSKSHTAAGISIRFPRFSRERSDKDWKTSTHLKELIQMV
ncbi:ATP-dependent DNA ligase [Murmansk poxvirus]|uniref:DNA ligase n=1 Tax=Murmansk poxvirus TaxID=2025359 RepID=A0A223FMZ4_9POXV|nr:ATP-dependent DNA ligase [Murmansk poxvirus]AST09363.1 ATP-dependent DNA ligase [Murmansk poxvirus]